MSKPIKLYKVTMVKRSISNPERWIYSDLEEFSENDLIKSVELLQKARFKILEGSSDVQIATERQIESARYVGKLQ